MTPELQRWKAYRDIDKAASEARLRYVPDVFGQAQVYASKAREAAAYLADPQGQVPPYIRAEVRVRRQPPADVAEAIVAAAAQWDEIKGPDIEAARIGGRLAVDEAADEAAIEAARVAAVAELEAL